MGIKNILTKPLAAARIAKNEGFLSLSIKSLQKIQQRKGKGVKVTKRGFTLLVSNKDVLKADWSKVNSKNNSKRARNSKLTINWIMSPPGKGSGGHQNLFRFIRYLEQTGHDCRVYLYSTIDQRTVSEIKNVLKDSYPKTKAKISWFSGEVDRADATFATGWETAYPVFNCGSGGKKFYFVQDFEPYFYPVGSEYILAENTYRFGFYGITAGGWLSLKLSRDYGMETDFFEFGAEKDLYKHTNESPRKEIFFYARPVTARRGFELGIMTLELFHKKHPEYIINLAGWDVSDYDIPFPYKNLKTLDLNELSSLYNRCSAALVLSLTNMSLLPLELLACGTIPVVNDGENNRLVSNNPYIAYAPSNPVALAEKMSAVVSRNDSIIYAQKAAASVSSQGWEKSGQKFVDLVEKRLYG